MLFSAIENIEVCSRIIFKYGINSDVVLYMYVSVFRLKTGLTDSVKILLNSTVSAVCSLWVSVQDCVCLSVSDSVCSSAAGREDDSSHGTQTSERVSPLIFSHLVLHLHLTVQFNGCSTLSGM